MPGLPIQSLGWCTSPEPLLAELDAQPELWNQHTPRREQYVHSRISDVWVRYNAWANYTGDLAAFNGPHASVWYPAFKTLPAIKPTLSAVLRHVGGRRLGGVLITRVPPGGRVAPHSDTGWHAEFYAKYALQLRGNADQAFCFEGASLSAQPGELYTFDNSKTHWVYNMSDEERITLIVCIRGGR